MYIFSRSYLFFCLFLPTITHCCLSTRFTQYEHKTTQEELEMLCRLEEEDVDVDEILDSLTPPSFIALETHARFKGYLKRITSHRDPSSSDSSSETEKSTDSPELQPAFSTESASTSLITLETPPLSPAKEHRGGHQLTSSAERNELIGKLRNIATNTYIESSTENSPSSASSSEYKTPLITITPPIETSDESYKKVLLKINVFRNKHKIISSKNRYPAQRGTFSNNIHTLKVHQQALLRRSAGQNRAKNRILVPETRHSQSLPIQRKSS